MKFHQTILFDPLSDLFGGGGSSSSATTTNQQVGAEGNSGPVFGAITIKGNKASNTKSKKATGSKGSTAQAPSTSTSGLPGVDTSTAGNLNISVVSGDTVAEQNTTTIAQGSIQSQNDLAMASIAAQNSLAESVLGVANNIAGASFGFASQTQTQLAQNVSDTMQAAQNLAAVGVAPQDAGSLISPTGGVAVQSGGITNFLLLAGIVVGVLALMKD